ncbi:putative calcium-dependent protein kinase [Corchorus olitorius]|uniref:Calcium-dependent protein kinase n=1 Tax=Corchorus olitorius TaxID=93759 RepID=A0A1R3JXC4_9ROSI|nr:putative calcium-dependent protein kinase [Corchorus olitorius]
MDLRNPKLKPPLNNFPLLPLHRSVLKTSTLPSNPPRSKVNRKPKSEITQAPLEPPPQTSNFIQTSS